MHVRVKPAKYIRKRSKGHDEIYTYVLEILKLVEYDIENALENGKSRAVTEINTNFSIPYMDNKDAQRDVYFYVAESLMQAGYKIEFEYCGIKAESQKVFLYTTWGKNKDVEYNRYKNHFLRQLTR